MRARTGHCPELFLREQCSRPWHIGVRIVPDIDEARSRQYPASKLSAALRVRVDVFIYKAYRSGSINVHLKLERFVREGHVHLVRYAWRGLRRSPGFTITAVLIIGLGIGSNAIVYSLLDALVLQPLPYPESDRLVALFGMSGGQRAAASYPDIRDWNSMAISFAEVSAWSAQSVTLTGGEEPARITGTMAGANYLRLIGVQPVRGRDFRAGEDQPGAQAAAILTDKLWHSRFAADPAVLGRTLILNDIPHVVIGILPAGFSLPWSDSDVLMPITSYPNFSLDRGSRVMIAMGRLKRGVTVEQAGAEITTIARALEQQYPETNQGAGASVAGVRDLLVEGVLPAIRILMGAVGFVLLLVCANLANLMMAKALGRVREVSIQASLGASRWTIFSQVAIESALLTGLGCALGIAIAATGIRILAARLADQLPPGVQLAVNGPLLGYIVVLAMLVGLVAAVLPGLRISSEAAREALRGRSGSSLGRGHNRIRRLLVAGQLAVAVVLIAGTALLTQSFLRLQGVSPGYRPEGLLTLEYRLPKTKYENPDLMTATHLRIADAVRAVPGVRSAGLIRALPFSGNGQIAPFSLAAKPEPPAAERPRARFNYTDPETFRTMEIPLLRGRGFTPMDRSGAARVVVINDSMARRYWPGEDPIGQQLRIPGTDFGSDTAVAAIVGVVGDIKHDGLDDREIAQIYVPIMQDAFVFASLVVRAEGDPMAMARAVQQAVWTVDRDQPVWKIRTLDTMIDRSLTNRRLIAGVIGIFSVIAALLAAIGLYAVMAYSVTRRAVEMGVRMALGATPGGLVRLVLREGLVLGVAGVAAGVMLAMGSARLIQSQLYGVTPGDPSTYAAVTLLLLLTAILASALPAWRASRVDPASALRSE
jgi:putative ABC transport system permease protein